MLTDLLICIHWWNPFVSKFLFPVINQIQELSVDYYVSKNLEYEQKVQYMEALTKTLRYHSRNTNKDNVAINNYTYTLVDIHRESRILQRLQYIMIHPIKTFSLWGSALCILCFIGSLTIVFEPSYKNLHDEQNTDTYYNINDQTYYIKNGDSYDLYMQNEYICTTPELFDEFGDVPIYESIEEVK